jgi:flagellar assembly protein FliH
MTRAHNRFIPGEELGAVVDWNFGAVDQASVRFAAKLKAQEAAEDQVKESVLRQSGYAEGFAQGHAQATMEGNRRIDDYISSQGQDTARSFGQLFESAQAQMAEAEQVMAKGVLELACELARQVLRHELSTNTNALQPVIREALGVLAVDSKAALVRMNPQDLGVLDDVLRQEFAGLALTLLGDASMVDGTLEKRWARAVASLGLESAWGASDDGR